MHRHFGSVDALGHVVKRRAEGAHLLAETHGLEMPGLIPVASDAARETALVTLLFWTALTPFSFTAFAFLIPFLCGYMVWKVGRSCWMGYSRLEKLHSTIEQEKYEINHHRTQEREELEALYRAKGFEGKLLDEVVDVLMADQNRLLLVMLEEEMGLTLEIYEHPIKQALGTTVGVLISSLLSLLLLLALPRHGILLASFLTIGGSALITAHEKKNRLIPAIVWNISISALAFGVLFLLSQLF